MQTQKMRGYGLTLVNPRNVLKTANRLGLSNRVLVKAEAHQTKTLIYWKQK